MNVLDYSDTLLCLMTTTMTDAYLKTGCDRIGASGYENNDHILQF